MDYYNDPKDTTKRQPDATPSATAPSRKPTMLRRLLSPHELATLLLLLHAPIAAFAKPEIPTLQEAGLIETVASDAGERHIRLTPDGNAVLRGLGIK